MKKISGMIIVSILLFALSLAVFSGCDGKSGIYVLEVTMANSSSADTHIWVAGDGTNESIGPDNKLSPGASRKSALKQDFSAKAEKPGKVTWNFTVYAGRNGQVLSSKKITIDASSNAEKVKASYTGSDITISK